MISKQQQADHARFLDSEEGTVFTAGCFMMILWIVFIGILWQFQLEARYWLKILTMGFTHALAGRAASIAHATSAGFNPGLTAGLAIYFDVMIMFIIYPLMIYSYKHLLERRFFKEHMQPVFEEARKNVTRFRRSKILGVFLFVWFPLWMTGIIMGAVLGYLLGLKTWVNLTTVILGSTSAVICWVFAYDRLFGWLGEIHRGIPVTLTAVIIIVLATLRILNQRKQD